MPFTATTSVPVFMDLLCYLFFTTYNFSLKSSKSNWENGPVPFLRRALTSFFVNIVEGG